MAADRPSRLARSLTVVAVLAAGACGGLIGWAVVDLQCTGDCTVQTGLGGLIGAVLAALGTALICVLAIQAMAEWHQQEGRRRASGSSVPR
jgi:hypothetical protein